MCAAYISMHLNIWITISCCVEGKLIILIGLPDSPDGFAKG